jgi:hypothetical protein
MTITLSDMRESLRGQRKADEAIFWFCHAWHSGSDSDLYRIMLETNFYPDQHRNRWARKLWKPDGTPDLDLNGEQKAEYDPEILYCFDVLETKFGPFIQTPMRPVKFCDVREKDVLVASYITDPKFRLKYGDRFVCIEKGWPCRVYKWHGDLGVACAEDHRGKQFHVLEADENGYVVGFVR